MASGRAADREDPENSRRNAARILDWDPISELHQGQRSHAPHRRAGHMTAPDHSASAASEIPCTRGPSTYEEDVMASGRAADREDPENSRRNAARILDWDPIS